MNQHVKILMKHLTDKGMELTLIPDFIKHIALIIADHPSLSLQGFNRKLKELGFNGFELDVKSLYLIVSIFETDLACRTANLPNVRQTSKDHYHSAKKKMSEKRS